MNQQKYFPEAQETRKKLLCTLTESELIDLLKQVNLNDSTNLIRQIYRFIRDRKTYRLQYLDDYISHLANPGDSIRTQINEIVSHKQTKLLEYEMFYHMAINSNDAREVIIWGAVRWCLIPDVDSPLFSAMSISEILDLLVENPSLSNVDFENKHLINSGSIAFGVSYLAHTLLTGNQASNKNIYNLSRRNLRLLNLLST